jgi:hypothetical protein
MVSLGDVVSFAASTSIVDWEGVGAPIATSTSFTGPSSSMGISSAGGVGVCMGGVIEIASEIE